jgi:hypothetical protein
MIRHYANNSNSESRVAHVTASDFAARVPAKTQVCLSAPVISKAAERDDNSAEDGRMESDADASSRAHQSPQSPYCTVSIALQASRAGHGVRAVTNPSNSLSRS